MKYTKEITDKLIADYKAGIPVATIATDLDVPERSVIAKLSSLGVYTKKSYVNKRGEVPVKKSEHIERIAELLDVDEELLESLEKVNKTVLKLIEAKLAQVDPKLVQPDIPSNLKLKSHLYEVV
jgi:hypothetical protein